MPKFGDSYWGNDLHPADVIEKHLERHLVGDRDDLVAFIRTYGELALRALQDSADHAGQRDAAPALTAALALRALLRKHAPR